MQLQVLVCYRLMPILVTCMLASDSLKRSRVPSDPPPIVGAGFEPACSEFLLPRNLADDGFSPDELAPSDLPWPFITIYTCNRAGICNGLKRDRKQVESSWNWRNCEAIGVMHVCIAHVYYVITHCTAYASIAAACDIVGMPPAASIGERRK